MKNSMSAAEISQCLTLNSLNARSWHVQACCALTGEGYVCFLGVCMFTWVFCLFKMFPSPWSEWKPMYLMCTHLFLFPLQFTSQSGLDALPCCGELVQQRCFLNLWNCWKRDQAYLRLSSSSQCLCLSNLQILNPGGTRFIHWLWIPEWAWRLCVCVCVTLVWVREREIMCVSV